MIVCSECGKESDRNLVNCSHCGAVLPSQTIPTGDLLQQSTMIVGSSAAGQDTEIVAESGPPTVSIPRPAPFAPLPDGSLVGGSSGEYQIKQLKNQLDELHEYQALSVEATQACPRCFYLHNPESESRCRSCGASLSSAAAAHLPVTILESTVADAFGVQGRLARLSVYSPHLRLPLDSFSRRVGGQQRHYLVLPPPPASWLGALRPPQEIPQVLQWGASLAAAMSTLHEEQIAFGSLGKGRLGLEGKQASLADFSTAIYPGRERLYRHDVIHLAGFLFYLMTGEQRYQDRPEIPEPVRDVFAGALSGGQGYDSAAAFQEALEQALAAIRRPAGVDYIVGRRTDVGQIRQLNEDSLLALHMVWNNKSVNYPLGIFAVADGMGGHAAGEIASGLALQAVAQSALEYLLKPEADKNLDSSHAEWVLTAVNSANKAVNDQVKASGNDMGTTLVVMLLVADQLYLANVGDSRAYLVNDQGIRQLTEDHSLVERLVASGQISRSDARSHPQRNVIYRTIGDRSEVEADSWQLQVKPSDRLLLCSDGLSGMVEDAEIFRLVRDVPTPQKACDILVQAANNAGGTDNITALMVQVQALT